MEPQEHEKIEFPVIDRLLGRGEVLLVVGGAGTGKSTLSRQLILAASRPQGEWLGLRLPRVPTRTLFVSEETTLTSEAAWYKYQEVAQPRLYPQVDFIFSRNVDLFQLFSDNTRGRFGFVILDPLTAPMHLLTETCAKLRAFAEEYNLAVIATVNAQAEKAVAVQCEAIADACVRLSSQEDRTLLAECTRKGVRFASPLHLRLSCRWYIPCDPLPAKGN